MVFITYYKINCLETGKCYFGKTRTSLAKRIRGHISNYKQFKKGNPQYKKCSSFDIIEKDNYKVVELLKVDGTNLTDEKIKQMERKYVEEGLATGFCLNKNIPNRKRKEYMELKQEYYNAYMRRTYRLEDSRYRNYKLDYYKKLKLKPKVLCKYCNKLVYSHSMIQHERTRKHNKAVEEYKRNNANQESKTI